MYPTREQAEKIVYCLNGDCEACSVREWCEGEETTNCGKAMLALYDALDAKQAELDKAKKLLNRLADETNFHGLDTEIREMLWGQNGRQG